MCNTHKGVRADDEAVMRDIAARDEGWHDPTIRRYELERAYSLGLERGIHERSAHASRRLDDHDLEC